MARDLVEARRKIRGGLGMLGSERGERSSVNLSIETTARLTELRNLCEGERAF
jgi:hypothetical protein